MQAAAIQTSVTVFRGLWDVNGDTRRMGWQRIVELLTRHKVGQKDGTLFCGAEFNGKRERGNVVARHLYVLDIETSKTTGEIPPEVEEVRLALIALGWAAIIYSTWNHEKNEPRFRVVLLPARSIRFDGDVKKIEADGDVTLGLAAAINLGGVVDRTKLCAESMFYPPRHGEGREHFSVYVDGDAITDEELEEAREVGRRLREDEDRYQAAASAPTTAKPDSVIAVYNSATSVSKLLEGYGYRRKPRSAVDWRSPLQQTESFATRVYDDRRFVTLSASDIEAGIGRKAPGGSAASGDAFDLFCYWEHKNDQRAAMKAAALALGLDAKKPDADTWDSVEPPTEDGDPFASEKPLPPLLNIRGLSAFAGEYQPASYLIDYMLQTSFLYSLTAETGAGKTALMILVSALVATGQPFGKAEVKRGSVIYCVGENADEFRQRIICLRESSYRPEEFDSIHVLTPEAHKGLLTERGASQVAEYAEALGGVDLVVVDTAAAFFDGEDENSNTELGEYARRLRRRLCSLPGRPCVVVCSHPTKNAQRHEELVPRGGGAFVAEVDGNLTLMKKDTGTSELFWSKKFRGRIENPISIALTPVEAQRTRDAKGRPLRSVLAAVAPDRNPDEERQERALRDRILLLMEDERLRSTTDVAVQLNEMLPGQAGGSECPGWKRVNRQLRTMTKESPARMTASDGRWRITPTGKKDSKGLRGPGRSGPAADASRDEF